MPGGKWQFIVSGDSRNCGDVVMPAIAAHSSRYAPAFYWHLGDLRALYKIDEDMAGAAEKLGETLDCKAYKARAWDDFIANQIGPFGATTFFVGIGNHELVSPKTEDDFSLQFADWLSTPLLQQQRLRDDPNDHRVKPYYHWIQGGIDFINLDNASNTFSPQQVEWFDRVLARDELDPNVRAVVAGMHEALPGSIASNHSMCDDEHKEGCASGEHIYKKLLDFRRKKPVYVLASHSHYFMGGIFNNQPPRQRLPGWIVGTAGAVRYSLPPHATSGAKTNVYGYLLATVDPSGNIDFQFQQVEESDVPAAVRQRYPSALVPWCFAHNSRNLEPHARETTPGCR